MQGDLPAEVTKSVAKAQVSHERLSRLLRTNRDTMNAFQTIVADMIKAGYKTERLPGPPGKREMLRATKTD